MDFINEVLSIKIDNRKPIQLLDFTNTILGVNNLYRIWAQDNKICIDDIELYIEELKEGSKIVDIVKKRTVKIFKDVTFSLFTSFYKQQIDTLLQENFEDILEKKQGKKIISNIQQSLNHNSNDLNSNLVITAKENQIIQNTFNITGIEANAVQKVCQDALQSEKKDIEIQEGCILMLKQAENSSETKKVDKGIIEDISDKTMSIIYKENIKQEIIMDKDNFFKMWFLVDVEIKRVNNTIVAYVITNLHNKGYLD